MEKNLDYYMNLKYEMVVRELSKETGGGIFIRVPALGESAVNAWRRNYKEAIKLLNIVKKNYFKTWLELGIEIPEPEEWWKNNV